MKKPTQIFCCYRFYCRTAILRATLRIVTRKEPTRAAASMRVFRWHWSLISVCHNLSKLFVYGLLNANTFLLVGYIEGSSSIFHDTDLSSARLMPPILPESNAETVAALKCAHRLWQTKKRYFLHSTLDWTPKYQESEVGIKRYVNNVSGIGGIVKGTWADFVVHEIRQTDGAIVELSKLSSEAEGPNPESLANYSSRGPRMIRFVLCKMGMDTISAVRCIAEFCRCPFHSVWIACLCFV